MALSQVTQENINEAEGMIRNALAHASRNERPYIIKELSQILWSLHQLESSDKVLDMVQDLDLQDNIKKDPF